MRESYDSLVHPNPDQDEGRTKTLLHIASTFVFEYFDKACIVKNNEYYKLDLHLDFADQGYLKRSVSCTSSMFCASTECIEGQLGRRQCVPSADFYSPLP